MFKDTYNLNVRCKVFQRLEKEGNYPTDSLRLEYFTPVWERDSNRKGNYWPAFLYVHGCNSYIKCPLVESSSILKLINHVQARFVPRMQDYFSIRLYKKNYHTKDKCWVTSMHIERTVDNTSHILIKVFIKE